MVGVEHVLLGVSGGVGGVVLLGALAIFVIGFLDDLSRLSAKTRLFSEFVVAAAVVWLGGLWFEEVRFLGVGNMPLPEWLEMPPKPLQTKPLPK